MPVDVEALYDELAAHGLGYGPMFRGLRALWRREGEVFAEVELPEEERAQAARFDVHPALLDAALHASAVLTHDPRDGEAQPAEVRLPFSWSGVRLHASGASSLRVRLSRVGSDGMSLTAVDDTGELVASIESLLTRTVSSEQLAAARDVARDSLFRVDWVPQSPSPAEGSPEIQWVTGLKSLGDTIDRDVVTSDVVCVDLAQLLREESGTGDYSGIGHDDPLRHDDVSALMLEATHQILHRVLALIQAWLDDQRYQQVRLLLLTRNAVAVSDKQSMAGLALAGVWGLVRSAQSENPGRLVLIDIDEDEASLQALPHALLLDEPQLAVRGGELLAPRLLRVGGSSKDAGDGKLISPAQDAVAQGTILITGGTGQLGSLLARHLVTAHGVHHLLLVSRQGPQAPGAAELETDLLAAGAQVTIAACDVGDRDQVRGLLAKVSSAHPLTGVVHAGGALDDGLIGSLTDERLDRVLTPKVDGAWHLHELTSHLDLSMFVLYSSAAGVLGGPAQGNYAAANSFLDALAAYRRARGMVATSMAWGLWAGPSGLRTQLEDADPKHLSRQGIASLSGEEGLALFDAALGADEALLVPIRLNINALLARARGATTATMFETVPPLLRGLVRAPLRRAGDSGSLARRLQDVPEQDRQQLVRDAVLAQVAEVLGHTSVAEIDAERPFLELGFDSLGALGACVLGCARSAACH